MSFAALSHNYLERDIIISDFMKDICWFYYPALKVTGRVAETGLSKRPDIMLTHLYQATLPLSLLTREERGGRFFTYSLSATDMVHFLLKDVSEGGAKHREQRIRE